MKENIEPEKDETLDFLSCAGLSIFQKKNGYRYSLDAYLLAAFVEEPAGTDVLEVGSGSGVVSILLAAVKGLNMTAIEIQEGLVEMSMRSVERARLSGNVHVICSDIKDYSGPKVDAIVTNPPYRPLKTGRINPRKEKAIARHEIALDLDTLLKKSYGLLRPHGRFYIVYPASRIPDLICSMRANTIEPKHMRCVFSSPGKTCEICLICALRDGGRDFTLESPIFIFKEDLTYHKDMDMVLKGLSLKKKPLTSRQDT